MNNPNRPTPPTQGRSVAMPVVKLYLGAGGGCKSAIAGIMYQPRVDALCTFQVRAARSAVQCSAVQLQTCVVMECCVGFQFR